MVNISEVYNILFKEAILEANLSLMRSENSSYTVKTIFHIYLPIVVGLADR